MSTNTLTAELPLPLQAESDHRRRSSFVYALLPAAIALAAWIFFLPRMAVDHANDLGLVSVMPVGMLAGLALLTIGFCFELRRREPSSVVLGAYVVVLTAGLALLPALSSTIATGHVTWRHAGIVDDIRSRGRIVSSTDAYFSWPGFFSLSAFATTLTGAKNIVIYARWAPLVFNLAYLVPVVVIIRSASRDVRVVALGAWTFSVANWVGQDYFSPQGFTYFLFLAALAVLLSTLRATDNPEGDARLAGPRQRVALLATVVLVVTAITTSHQLTPYALLIDAAVVVVAGRCISRGLPILVGVIVVGWLVFGAWSYLSGHGSQLFHGVGGVSTNVGANVGERIHGSAQHLVIVRSRLFLTGALWFGAALGAAVWLKRYRGDVVYVFLGIAPFVLLGLQPYGGEALLRVYLFTLPFAVLLLARFAIRATRLVSLRWLLVTIGLIAMMFLSLFARYGNDHLDRFGKNEVAAVDALYHLAPKGSYLVAAVENVTWRSEGYSTYKYATLEKLNKQHALDLSPNAIATRIGRRDQKTYLILTKEQGRYSDALGIFRLGMVEKLFGDVSGSSRFERVYENDDAVIFLVREGSS